jgi:hypothetical protein
MMKLKGRTLQTCTTSCNVIVVQCVVILNVGDDKKMFQVAIIN